VPSPEASVNMCVVHQLQFTLDFHTFDRGKKVYQVKKNQFMGCWVTVSPIFFLKISSISLVPDSALKQVTMSRRLSLFRLHGNRGGDQKLKISWIDHTLRFVLHLLVVIPCR